MCPCPPLYMVKINSTVFINLAHCSPISQQSECWQPTYWRQIHLFGVRTKHELSTTSVGYAGLDIGYIIYISCKRRPRKNGEMDRKLKRKKRERLTGSIRAITTYIVRKKRWSLLRPSVELFQVRICTVSIVILSLLYPPWRNSSI